MIVVSNLSSEADVARATELGAIGYLAKSDYTGDELAKEALAMYHKSIL